VTSHSSESAIQRAIRLDPEVNRLAVFWRNHVGEATDATTRVRHVFGLCVGSSDLIGLLRENGRFVAIETKSLTGRLSPEQSMFLRLVARCGGLCGVARSVDDARAILRGDKGHE
jgi:hypothetical protein